MKEIEDLAKELDELELDAGIKIVDEESNEIFITRSGHEFCIMFKDNWFYTNDISRVMEIVKRYSKGEIKAFLY